MSGYNRSHQSKVNFWFTDLGTVQNASYVSHNGDVRGLQLEHLINFQIKTTTEKQLPAAAIKWGKLQQFSVWTILKPAFHDYPGAFSLSSWHFIFYVWNKQDSFIIKTLPTCWFLQTWLFFPWRSSWQCSLLCLGTPGNSWTWPARQSAPAGWHTAELTPPAQTPGTLHPSTLRPAANALSLFYRFTYWNQLPVPVCHATAVSSF